MKKTKPRRKASASIVCDLDYIPGRYCLRFRDLSRCRKKELEKIVGHTFGKTGCEVPNVDELIETLRAIRDAGVDLIVD
jgi:hypothetical protein